MAASGTGAAGEDRRADIELQAAEDKAEGIAPADLKIILLGDSAVGKSKLVERFLLDNYHPRTRSTYALTLYRHEMDVEEDVVGEGAEDSAGAAGGGAGDASSGAAHGPTPGKRKRRIAVDFWDTAGQERFASMHPSYYYKAHGCILVFDVTRKVTYQNLVTWYQELRGFCERIPCLCIANKIDVDLAVTKKSFAFATKNDLPFYFVSAADGTNVVAIFERAVQLAWDYKTKGEKDFVSEVLELLDDKSLGALGHALYGPSAATRDEGEGGGRPAAATGAAPGGAATGRMAGAGAAAGPGRR